MDEEFLNQQMEKYRQRKEKAPTIIRIKKRELPFVQIDKRPVEDIRLSWKAKGLLLYLLSKPNNWKIYLSDLIKRSRDKSVAVYSGLKELEKFGYLERERIRNKKGRFIRLIYTIYEVPPKH
jgi:DNA-binding MarR family transcriptional regulator